MSTPRLRAVLLLLAACSAATAPRPRADAACADAGEFRSSGCFAVEGVVVHASGRPYAGAVLQLRYPAGSGSFSGGLVTTGADGLFRLVGTRVSGAPAPGVSDSAVAFVHAIDPATAGVGAPARVRDSVRVSAAVAPVGRVPAPAQARVTLGG